MRWRCSWRSILQTEKELLIYQQSKINNQKDGIEFSLPSFFRLFVKIVGLQKDIAKWNFKGGYTPFFRFKWGI
jgi:hypothetical protein